MCVVAFGRTTRIDLVIYIYIYKDGLILFEVKNAFILKANKWNTIQTRCCSCIALSLSLNKKFLKNVIVENIIPSILNHPQSFYFTLSKDVEYIINININAF